MATEIFAGGRRVQVTNPESRARLKQAGVDVDGDGSQAPTQQSASSDGGSAGPAFSLPDFSSPGDKVLLVVAVLLIGLALYGRLVKPINLGPPAINLGPPVQSYIDQQNRKVALISDTMPGRILRTNPARLGSS